MLRSASIAAAIAASAAAVANAQACQKDQFKCVDGTDSLLMYCNGGTWATKNCPPTDYCMTMGPNMVHCMLRPDNEKPAPTSKPAAPTATASGSKSATPSPTTAAVPASTGASAPKSADEKGTASAAPSSTTKNSANSNKGVLAVFLGLPIAGLAALF